MKKTQKKTIRAKTYHRTRKDNDSYKKYFHVALFLIVTGVVSFTVSPYFFVQPSQAANLSIENDGDIYDTSLNFAPIETLRSKGDKLIADRVASIDAKYNELKSLMTYSSPTAFSFSYLRLGIFELTEHRMKLLQLKTVIDHSTKSEDVRNAVHAIFTDHRVNKLLIPKQNAYVAFAKLDELVMPTRLTLDTLRKRAGDDIRKKILTGDDAKFVNTVLTLRIQLPLDINQRNKVMTDSNQLKVKLDALRLLKAIDYINDDQATVQKIKDVTDAIVAVTPNMQDYVTKIVPGVKLQEDQLAQYLDHKEQSH